MSDTDRREWAEALRSKYGIPAPEVSPDWLEDTIDEALGSIYITPWMEGR